MKKLKKVIIKTKKVLNRGFLLLLTIITGQSYFIQVNPLSTFIIKTDFGEAGFMKRYNHMAICLHSSESTYERNREYYIQDNEIVIKTSK